MVKSYNMRDQNPQWLNGYVIESAANTYTEAAIQTPVVNTAGVKPMVMEILRIFFFGLNTIELRNILDVRKTIVLLKKSQSAMVRPDHPDCIAAVEGDITVIDTAATDGTIVSVGPISPQVIELTDGQGNGYLCGSKQIFLGLQSVNASAVKNASIKILYRLKSVEPTEMLGILSE